MLYYKQTFDRFLTTKMPEPEEENSYWQKIMETTFADSLWKPFKPRFCYFLKTLALEIDNLNKPGHPEEINESRFKEICRRFQYHAPFIDHLALNLGPNRLEHVSRIAFQEGFKPVHYFMPSDEKNSLFSLVVAHPKTGLFVTLNEGIDGWTVKTANRLIEFRRFLNGIYQNTLVHLPEIKIRTDLKTHQKYLLIMMPKNYRPAFIHLDDGNLSDSSISASVKKRGEFLSHIALDTERIVTPSLATGSYQPRTINELFSMISINDILPLSPKNITAENDIIPEPAGRAPSSRHDIKRFFTQELAHGFFLEFIERTGEGTKKGLYPSNECLI